MHANQLINYAFRTIIANDIAFCYLKNRFSLEAEIQVIRSREGPVYENSKRRCKKYSNYRSC